MWLETASRFFLEGAIPYSAAPGYQRFEPGLQLIWLMEGRLPSLLGYLLGSMGQPHREAEHKPWLETWCWCQELSTLGGG